LTDFRRTARPHPLGIAADQYAHRATKCRIVRTHVRGEWATRSRRRPAHHGMPEGKRHQRLVHLDEFGGVDEDLARQLAEELGAK